MIRTMNYTLYYSPGAASLAVHWMLLELGVPYDLKLIDIHSDQQFTPDFLKLSPRGRLPVLVVDGQPYTESAALLMLLAERHPNAGLAPRPNEEGRAKWLETMVYLANGLLPPMRDWFYADKDGDPVHAEGIRALVRKRMEDAWTRLNAEFGDERQFMVDGRLSTADFLATMIMRWSRNMPKPATSWPRLNAYVQRMRARPAFIELYRREQLTEWANS
jgi:glutathione S-transferase